MVKFNKDDYNKWKTFRADTRNINQQEFKMVCQLHAKYYKHQLHYPCLSCSINHLKRFINELNIIYDNGYK